MANQEAANMSFESLKEIRPSAVALSGFIFSEILLFDSPGSSQVE